MCVCVYVCMRAQDRRLRLTRARAREFCEQLGTTAADSGGSGNNNGSLAALFATPDEAASFATHLASLCHRILLAFLAFEFFLYR